jgi:hypothetical protein
MGTRKISLGSRENVSGIIEYLSGKSGYLTKNQKSELVVYLNPSIVLIENEGSTAYVVTDYNLFDRILVGKLFNLDNETKELYRDEEEEFLFLVEERRLTSPGEEEFSSVYTVLTVSDGETCFYVILA